MYKTYEYPFLYSYPWTHSGTLPIPILVPILVPGHPFQYPYPGTHFSTRIRVPNLVPIPVPIWYPKLVPEPVPRIGTRTRVPNLVPVPVPIFGTQLQLCLKVPDMKIFEKLILLKLADKVSFYLNISSTMGKKKNIVHLRIGSDIRDRKCFEIKSLHCLLLLSNRREDMSHFQSAYPSHLERSQNNSKVGQPPISYNIILLPMW